MQFSTQAGDRASARRLARRRLRAERPLPRRHAPDGREVREAVFPSRQALVLARQHRTGPTRGMGPGGFSATATGSSRRACAATGEALQAGPARRRDPRHHPVEHPHRDQRIRDIKAQARRSRSAKSASERSSTVRRRRRRARRGRARATGGQQMRAKIARSPTAPTRALPSSTRRRRRRAARHPDGASPKEGGPEDAPPSSSTCPARRRRAAGRWKSVIATTRSSIYLADQHVFPDVRSTAGTFAPLTIVDPEGTFLYAKYPGGRFGCAAEVSQRIAEAVFAALTQAIPIGCSPHRPAPRATSRSAASTHCASGRYVMYVISGGYGGHAGGDRHLHGCSPSASPDDAPSSVMERTIRCCSRSSRCTRARVVPARFRGGFGITTPFACAAARPRRRW